MSIVHAVKTMQSASLITCSIEASSYPESQAGKSGKGRLVIDHESEDDDDERCLGVDRDLGKFDGRRFFGTRSYGDAMCELFFISVRPWLVESKKDLSKKRSSSAA